MLLYSTAVSATFYSTIYAIRSLGFIDHEFTVVSRDTALYIVFGTYIVLNFGAMVPAYAIFIRVATSMDPSQESDDRRHPTRHLDIKSAYQGMPLSIVGMLFARFYAVLIFEFLGVTFLTFTCLITFPGSYDEVGRFFVKYAG
jgi:hypothetical protein